MDLSVNPVQILVMFCIFMASAFVLTTLVFKPTLAILKEREKRLSGLSQVAKSLEETTREKVAAYDKLMSEARAVARSARESLLRAAEDEQKRVLGEARNVAETRIGGAKQVLSAEVSQARLTLRGEANEIAILMADKILKRKAA